MLILHATVVGPGIIKSGISAAGIPFIFGVDRLLDMARTFMNITGDRIACAVLNNKVREKQIRNLLKGVTAQNLFFKSNGLFSLSATWYIRHLPVPVGARRTFIRSNATALICLTLFCVVNLLLWSLFSSAALGVHPEILADEEPAPTTVEELETPLSEGFKERAEGLHLFPEWKQKLKSLSPFFRDTTLNLHLRSYYFNQQNEDDSPNQAWALGGWIDYASGRWKDIFQISAVAYTSQKLYGPKDKGGTLLLKPVQQGFSSLGEAYLDAKIMEGLHFRGFRQAFNLPYVNKQDNRMVPNTFEAVSLIGRSIHKTDFIVAHITKMKTRDSNEFRYISDVADVPGANRGLTLAGVRYVFSRNLNMGVITHYAWDLWNVLYAEGNFSMKLVDDAAIALSAQYTDQRSVGNKLAGNFNTNVFSTKAEMSYLGNILSLTFSTTDNNSGIRSPFGSYPGYLSLIVKDFDRAGETAWGIGFSSHFKFLGLEGLSAFANYAEGKTPDSGIHAWPDQKELDITVDYRFKQSFLKSLWLRFRTAFVRQDGPDSQDIDQYRIILNYDLPVL